MVVKVIKTNLSMHFCFPLVKRNVYITDLLSLSFFCCCCWGFGEKETVVKIQSLIKICHTMCFSVKVTMSWTILPAGIWTLLYSMSRFTAWINGFNKSSSKWVVTWDVLLLKHQSDLETNKTFIRWSKMNLKSPR